ncbi:phospholipase D-like domain-containing protein [Mesorhizobium sp. M7A.F.Ca.CA.002.03.2.1]|uniref:phospholipase D-like domain-containing protein n=1 Tax=Mesorhizobium sp. M7A.F.Ca.CA.002.03.2.1 TaxID=2496680 RepID=UPI000FD2DEDF|nr:phospholipase D-like domain-containing protein [Mesorhizobium sp. M7A.F.Ca.CA.002.03.2.1]RVB66107.1 hypothetical protein EN895_10380 [Mesorhizobium sp. M7A.F.Ca.CA.002.03.2.1]
MDVLVQSAGTAETLGNAVRAWSEHRPCTGFWVAAAYATVSGVRELLGALTMMDAPETHWLVGLDDYITQPGALRLIQSLPGAQIRVAGLSSKDARFHPKLYFFKSTSKEETNLLVVGSANLTRAALRKNCEANAIGTGGKNSTEAFDAAWSQLWSIGEELTAEKLSEYEQTYLKIRPLRDAIARLTTGKNEKEPPVKKALDSDQTEVDPALATTCWIEGGNITLMGKELEFKAEQALFFGLSSNGGEDSYFNFKTSAGTVAKLKMRYQQNHMWRLQLNDEVPEVKVGLRPKDPDGSLGRSPYVAVFERTKIGGTFVLGFLHLESKEFSRLKRQSERYGATGSTIARQYGWF